MVSMVVLKKSIYIEYYQKAMSPSSSLDVSSFNKKQNKNSQIERSQTWRSLHFCVIVVMCTFLLVQVRVEMLKVVYYSDPIALLDCHLRCNGSW